MCSPFRLLLCAATVGLAVPVHAIPPSFGTTRTLGQTGVHQFELQLDLDLAQPELFDTVSLDWSALEAPLPNLHREHMWLTTNDEGMRHLSLGLAGATPWVDAICAPTPDQLEGSAVPEPEALALAFAVAAFAWVALRRHQQALATARV